MIRLAASGWSDFAHASSCQNYVCEFSGPLSETSTKEQIQESYLRRC